LLLPKFEQFIRERQYLHNVSPATVSWHTHNLKWLPSECPTQDELKQVVIRMREKGLRPTGCNSAIRSINAYLKWAGSPLKIPQMKEPNHVLPTYSQPQIQLLLGWKPKRVTGHRLSTLISLLADTGCRINEALTTHWSDVDFDNLLVLLHGNVFHLQKVLGHSSLEMTRRYANLMTEDLQAVHQRLSLLA
jgi:integrase/recombinase XerD